jgi:hypothetical protein
MKDKWPLPLVIKLASGHRDCLSHILKAVSMGPLPHVKPLSLVSVSL